MPGDPLQTFHNNLLEWHEKNPRDMPWKNTENPYQIWISEVILQQTRVQQGWHYYLKFIEKFPDVATLARATTDEVLKAWEGLGYYTRARNLHKAAKLIMDEMHGVFPNSHDLLLKLPGTGSYTAAAVASFAYNQPFAVVDGNVIRVLSRYFGIFGEGKEKVLKDEVRAKANSLVHLGISSSYNQAIMNFGAMQCVPAKPDCVNCALSSACFAFQHNQVRELPPKPKAVKRKDRYFIYFLMKYKDGFYIRQRTTDDIWKNLYELPCIESDEFWSLKSLPESLKTVVNNALPQQNIYKHILTHQTIYARVFLITLKQENTLKLDKLQYVEPNNLRNFAFPKLILNILQQQGFNILK